MDNQNTSPNEDQVPGKNQDVPSTSRPNDPTRMRSSPDLHGGCLSGSSNSRRHPAAGIPTGNIGGGPSDEIQAETAGGENSLKSRIEGLAGKRTRMEVAKSLNMSVSSFDKLQKNLDIRVWPRVNKKTKLTHELSSAAILSLPSSSNAASNGAESNGAESNDAASNAAESNASVATISALASTLSSALVPLLAASSNPTNTLALTNLPSSSSNRDGDKFKLLCINDKPDYMEKEIQNLDVNAIKVRANFKLPNGYWRLLKFTIDKNTTYNRLSEILLSKLVPVPRKMKIVYEDGLGDFVDLADDRDMILCLHDCGRLINLVIEEEP